MSKYHTIKHDRIDIIKAFPKSVVNNYSPLYCQSIFGTVAKLAMRQPFVLFKGLTFQKLCLP
ncbi:hypothetical protein, partial [Enterobacter hormaechei]|uniref:hypothetical protein n=1 Tax=Enterobacter hormaechei TaxID=158836 RepID=UPI0022467456